MAKKFAKSSGAPLHTLSKLNEFPLVLCPLPLILGSVLLYVQSPKDDCCSISDDLSCSFKIY